MALSRYSLLTDTSTVNQTELLDLPDEMIEQVCLALDNDALINFMSASVHVSHIAFLEYERRKNQESGRTALNNKEFVELLAQLQRGVGREILYWVTDGVLRSIIGRLDTEQMAYSIPIILRLLLPMHQLAFLNQIGISRIRSVMQVAHQLLALLDALAIKNRIPFLTALGSEVIHNVRGEWNLYSLLKACPSETRADFLRQQFTPKQRNLFSQYYLDVLTLLPQADRKSVIVLLGMQRLFEAIKQGATPHDLRNIAYPDDALVKILESLDEVDRLWLIVMLKEQLPSIVDGPHALYAVTRCLPIEKRLDFITLWLAQDITAWMMRRKETLSTFSGVLDILSSQQQLAFIAWLGRDNVYKLLPDFNLLIRGLNVLKTEENKLLLLRYINTDQLTLILDLTKLAAILKQLDRQAQSDFLLMFSDEQLYRILIGGSHFFTWALRKLDAYKHDDCYTGLLSAAIHAYCARQQHKTQTSCGIAKKSESVESSS